MYLKKSQSYLMVVSGHLATMSLLMPFSPIVDRFRGMMNFMPLSFFLSMLVLSERRVNVRE